MGCCGSRNTASDWEVTFRDGSKTRFKTLQEARIAAGKDQTVDPNGRRKYPAMKQVPKL